MVGPSGTATMLSADARSPVLIHSDESPGLGAPTTHTVSPGRGVSVVNVSNDLPFAQARFCGAEGIENVQTASAFRDSFGHDYGVTIADGPMAGLLARAVVVIGADGNVAYEELVPEIAQEPNYDAALEAVKSS